MVERIPSSLEHDSSPSDTDEQLAHEVQETYSDVQQRIANHQAAIDKYEAAKRAAEGKRLLGQSTPDTSTIVAALSGVLQVERAQLETAKIHKDYLNARQAPELITRVMVAASELTKEAFTTYRQRYADAIRGGVRYVLPSDIAEVRLSFVKGVADDVAIQPVRLWQRNMGIEDPAMADVLYMELMQQIREEIEHAISEVTSIMPTRHELSAGAAEESAQDDELLPKNPAYLDKVISTDSDEWQQAEKLTLTKWHQSWKLPTDHASEPRSHSLPQRPPITFTTSDAFGAKTAFIVPEYSATSVAERVKEQEHLQRFYRYVAANLEKVATECCVATMQSLVEGDWRRYCDEVFTTIIHRSLQDLAEKLDAYTYVPSLPEATVLQTSPIEAVAAATSLRPAAEKEAAVERGLAIETHPLTDFKPGWFAEKESRELQLRIIQVDGRRVGFIDARNEAARNAEKESFPPGRPASAENTAIGQLGLAGLIEAEVMVFLRTSAMSEWIKHRQVSGTRKEYPTLRYRHGTAKTRVYAARYNTADILPDRRDIPADEVIVLVGACLKSKQEKLLAELTGSSHSRLRAEGAGAV